MAATPPAPDEDWLDAGQLAEVSDALARDALARDADDITVILKLIEGVHFFKSLSTDVRTVLARCIMLEEYEANKVIFSEGDPGETYYVILAGQVSIRRRPDLVASSKVSESRANPSSADSSRRGSTSSGPSRSIIPRMASVTPLMAQSPGGSTRSDVPVPDAPTPSDDKLAIIHAGIVLVRLKAGQGFGEVALLSKATRSRTATAVADVSCSLLTIAKDDYLRCIRTVHERDARDKVAALCAVPELRASTLAQLRELAAFLTRVTYKAGDIILGGPGAKRGTGGAIANGVLYIVAEGRVDMVPPHQLPEALAIAGGTQETPPRAEVNDSAPRPSDDTLSCTVSSGTHSRRASVSGDTATAEGTTCLGPGDFFGDAALGLAHRPAAAALCRTPCSVLQLAGPDLGRHVAPHARDSMAAFWRRRCAVAGGEAAAEAAWGAYKRALVAQVLFESRAAASIRSPGCHARGAVGATRPRLIPAGDDRGSIDRSEEAATGSHDRDKGRDRQASPGAALEASTSALHATLMAITAKYAGGGSISPGRPSPAMRPRSGAPCIPAPRVLEEVTASSLEATVRRRFAALTASPRRGARLLERYQDFHRGAAVLVTKLLPAGAGDPLVDAGLLDAAQTVWRDVCAQRGLLTHRPHPAWFVAVAPVEPANHGDADRSYDPTPGGAAGALASAAVAMRSGLAEVLRHCRWELQTKGQASRVNGVWRLIFTPREGRSAAATGTAASAVTDHGVSELLMCAGAATGDVFAVRAAGGKFIGGLYGAGRDAAWALCTAAASPGMQAAGPRASLTPSPDGMSITRAQQERRGTGRASVWAGPGSLVAALTLKLPVTLPVLTHQQGEMLVSAEMAALLPESLFDLEPAPPSIGAALRRMQRRGSQVDGRPDAAARGSLLGGLLGQETFRLVGERSKTGGRRNAVGDRRDHEIDDHRSSFNRESYVDHAIGRSRLAVRAPLRSAVGAPRAYSVAATSGTTALAMTTHPESAEAAADAEVRAVTIDGGARRLSTLHLTASIFGAEIGLPATAPPNDSGPRRSHRASAGFLAAADKAEASMADNAIAWSGARAALRRRGRPPLGPGLLQALGLAPTPEVPDEFDDSGRGDGDDGKGSKQPRQWSPASIFGPAI